MGAHKTCLFWLWWLFLIFLLLRLADAVDGDNPTGHFYYHERFRRYASIDSVEAPSTVRASLRSVGSTAGNYVPKKTSKTTRPKTPLELGMSQCNDDLDCSHDSMCVAGPNKFRTCICAGSCPPSVPVSCRTEGKYADDYCLSMSDDYREKYLMPKPMCKTGVCVCPPMFERWSGFDGFVSLLPIKCAKSELRIQGFAYPSKEVYVGGQVQLFCCINIDPRSFVLEEGVRFIHNSSIIRRSTSTPFKGGFMDGVEPSRCWVLNLTSVNLSDGGTYTCCAQVGPTATIRAIDANDTFTLKVKAGWPGRDVVGRFNSRSSFLIPLRSERLEPDGLVESHRALTISRRHTHQNTSFSQVINNTEQLKLFWDFREPPVTNATCATFEWKMEENVVSHAELSLVRRSPSADVEVWKDRNVSPGVTVCELSPGTLYAVQLNVVGVSNDTMNITKHFRTNESKPGPPIIKAMMLSHPDELRYCELVWTAPKAKNGAIKGYYVTVRGSLLSVPPSGVLSSDDFPPGLRPECTNDNGTFTRNINAIMPSSIESYLCYYGPLKPNRNYTATLWAENSAGRSPEAVFSGDCVTPYGKPESVVVPVVSSRNNTSFELQFTAEQDEVNGPIVCYYLAIIPLAESVSLESLPPPNRVPIDTFSHAISNNIDNPKRPDYFAYIAESYARFPNSTVVGDGNPPANTEPCNIRYQSRYGAEDQPLKPQVKYTGYLIARVEEKSSGAKKNSTPESSAGIKRNTRKTKKRAKRFGASIFWAGEDVDEVYSTLQTRIYRSLHPKSSISPMYAFSAYFKPIILRSDGGKTGLSLLNVLFILLAVFLMLAVTSAVLILYRRGFINEVFSKGEDPLYAHFRRSHGSLPIPVAELLKAYQLRSRDSDRGFDKEYETLPRTERFHKANASKLPENREKNRYGDKHTFDDTRVKLSRVDGIASSDYINANYINGYKGKKKFIATQGPKETTQADFWKMVWEQNARVIVMITNLQEGNVRQCSQYWPERENSKIYGDFEVRHLGENICRDYVIREFEMRHFTKLPANGSLNGCNAVVTYVTGNDNGVVLEPSSVTVSRATSEHGSERSLKINSNYENFRATKTSQGNNYQRLSTGAVDSSEDPKRVVQYHFTSWPDFGTPACTTSFLRFVLKLRKLEEFNNSTVVVHCSAGCGRTGTFIAVDSLLDQCIEKGKADIFGFVSQLRDARGGMIQNSAQYRFIYRALATWHLYGNTDIEARNFRDHYRNLLQASDERRQSNGFSSSVVAALFRTGSDSRNNNEDSESRCATKIEEEFKRLQDLLDPPPRISFAHEKHNAVKNRFEEAVPYDHCRVILPIRIKRVKCTEDSTYINASQFKGHYFHYVLAQDPVNEESCYDFWQMIEKYRSKIIVMLSNDNEFAPNERYWPNELGKSVSFGSENEVSVKLVDEKLADEAKPTYILRKITYKFAEEKCYHEVTQFDYLCWPRGHVVPTSAKSLINLIDLVLKSQVSHDEDIIKCPIVLHSRDGSSETGIFCCITLLLERLRSEECIDVFQTVRSLQRCRPRIISSLEQYRFCYEAVLEYLERTPVR